MKHEEAVILANQVRIEAMLSDLRSVVLGDKYGITSEEKNIILSTLNVVHDRLDLLVGVHLSFGETNDDANS